MDPGFRSPFIDFFRRGDVARDVRLTAAQGALAPRAHEQLALLLILTDDPEPAIAASAHATLDALPLEPLRAFIARSDVPQPMRDFFAARGVQPGEAPLADASNPLTDTSGALPAVPEEAEETTSQVLSTLPIIDRMKLGMKGSRAHRAVLIRDPNKLVAAAVLSSPKLTETEVEGFAKMANVSEDVLRVISMNRAWIKNYGVISGLTRNPKTPPAISMQLVQRLNQRDVKMLAMDRNVPEALRLAARKFIVKT